MNILILILHAVSLGLTVYVLLQLKTIFREVRSPVIRQKVWDWYANDLYTRLSAGAWVVLTHTRWHRDDLAGRLLRKMADRAADPWEILCLPAILEEGAAANPCDQRRPGGAAWPQVAQRIPESRAI